MWSTDWIELARDRERWRALLSAVMNLRVPQNTGNFLTSCKPVGYSRTTVLCGVSKYPCHGFAYTF
jgi:CRISPR/Cas system-associated protein Cas7 (RAMP superfamily)